MTLADLLRELPPTGLDEPAFPERMLGAFRRKSITFCTGLTDEATVVYWFQSRSFTIDLRLPDTAETPPSDRQGWIGDTLWDARFGEMSWAVATSYQLHNQWPEPARFQFIGNSVIEFAPSGAYVEDWRQQSSQGPLLGLRLLAMIDEAGHELPMDGGLIVAGEHAAFARSRMPQVDAALRQVASLGQALDEGIVSARDIESYEVSVAMGGRSVSHSTCGERLGQDTVSGDFALQSDGTVLLSGASGRLRFAIDTYRPDFTFARQTECSAAARQWLEAERGHLAQHAVVAS